MSGDLPSFDGAHFDELYRERPDPWDVGSWYERRKLACLLAALPRERYGSGLELGCSVGATTEALAHRCDTLLAVDASTVAVEAARRRVSAHPGVQVEVASLPDQMPSGGRDLVVMGEIGYFLATDALDRLVARLPGTLRPGGDLVAVHWRHDGHTLPVPGEEVHRRLAATGLPRRVRHEEDDFLLEVWTRD